MTKEHHLPPVHPWATCGECEQTIPRFSVFRQPRPTLRMPGSRPVREFCTPAHYLCRQPVHTPHPDLRIQLVDFGGSRPSR